MPAEIYLRDYAAAPDGAAFADRRPWSICANANGIVGAVIAALPVSWRLLGEDIAVHESATIEEGAVIKAPCIVGERCLVGAHAYLRGGVWLGNSVVIGASVEIKSSFIGAGSRVAHFNFVGNSIVGADVNIEAGAILANHRNEATDKEIVCVLNGRQIRTGCDKFGALVADGCRIGANAVLAPGTILGRGTVVPRLKLIDQAAEFY
jgi:UDP-N-acetylglucosamine diphosphorylase / glucose-1-phosphate thymidylyltransferase / UDP-N-acetylgalactosamine diphosphorylase / glucosamine-1-phosphate N-acetyltransferase / galactosamine-1-phosphate N-acetyltransferase